MEDQEGIRRHVTMLLRGRIAHATPEEALAHFPVERVNDTITGVPYSPWRLLEHMRITQRDILDFVRDPDYEEPRWPDDYWPAPGEQADAARWEASVRAFKDDLTQVIAMAEDPSTDMYAVIPWGDGQTMVREFLLVADHNSYHVGEMVLLRRALGIWPP
jgi:uncharacterized damage-inducible protein DinB